MDSPNMFDSEDERAFEEFANLIPRNKKIESVLNIDPKSLASQITITDFNTFQKIKKEELLSCGWGKKDKIIKSPNVVAFTDRFNQVSYWAVDEILKVDDVKLRSEVVSHFIKVCKKLYDLNNLHSLFAILCALQNASIFRLQITWSHVSKADKNSFNKLTQLFADDSNWAKLREYMKKLKVPCVPYLGIFLTDLVYLNLIHSDNTSTKHKKMLDSLMCLFEFQENSDYNFITPDTEIQDFISSFRYIEELQRFQEKNHYQLSLKLEPSQTAQSSQSSQPSTSSAGSSLEQMKGSDEKGPLRHKSLGSLFPTSYDRRILENKFHSASLPRKFMKIINSSSGVLEINPTMRRMNIAHNALVESPPTSSSSTANTNETESESSLNTSLQVKYEGPIQRKCLLKNTNKPHIKVWQNYWAEITSDGFLVLYLPKAFKNFSFDSERSCFRRSPSKAMQLKYYDVATDIFDMSTDLEIICGIFQIISKDCETKYAFRVANNSEARRWVIEINNTTFL